MSTPDHDMQPSTEPVGVRELKLANLEWAKALAERDEAALDRLLSDDFVLAYPFEGDDKGQFIADVMNGDVKVESLESQGATIRVSAGTAIIFGSETANWRYRGRDLSGNYRFLRVYTRDEDRWRIMALHLCAR